ncbi:acetyltransferase [Alteromonas sediminis]|uniref:acetyltransferase n=1 Tax=Alteromonas sediminis TaxID=2259342 RepID=UPI0014050EAD|nr:acetyltransferase [Alteromonas sediminis]
MISERTELVIIGAGGHAKVVIETACAMGYQTIWVFDDNPEGSKPLGYHIQGTCEQAIEATNKAAYFVAIGANAVRLRLLNALIERKKSLATLVHPSAVVSPSAKIGKASLVVAKAVINADASLGLGCIVNTAATVDHDCVVADGAHIAPGANLCGGVTVGKETLIGAGSAILPQKKIGDKCIVGAGSTVISDIPEGHSAVGSPAKIMIKN